MLKRLFQSTKKVANQQSQQAELDALTKQVESLKLAIASSTPGTLSSTPESSFNKNKGRRAVVSRKVELDQVLQPQKTHSSDKAINKQK